MVSTCTAPSASTQRRRRSGLESIWSRARSESRVASTSLPPSSAAPACGARRRRRPTGRPSRAPPARRPIRCLCPRRRSRCRTPRAASMISRCMTSIRERTRGTALTGDTAALTSSPRISTATSSSSTVIVGARGRCRSRSGIRRSARRPRRGRGRRRRGGASTRSPRGTSHPCRGSATPAVGRRRGTCSTCPIPTCRRRRRRLRTQRCSRGASLPVSHPIPGFQGGQQVLGARSSSTTSSTSPVSRPGSWSMRTSSMLTSLSPASANSRARARRAGRAATRTPTGSGAPALRACPGSPGSRRRRQRAATAATPGRCVPRASMTASSGSRTWSAGPAPGRRWPETIWP